MKNEPLTKEKNKKQENDSPFFYIILGGFIFTLLTICVSLWDDYYIEPRATERECESLCEERNATLFGYSYGEGYFHECECIKDGEVKDFRDIQVVEE